MADSFSLEGIESVARALAALPGQADVALAKALYEEGLRIMATSQPLVPVDTGLLRSTGAVETENTAGPEAVVKLSYGGGGQAPYAVYVHERVDLHHPVGQHHFLSQPFYEATAGMAERLAASIRQSLGGT